MNNKVLYNKVQAEKSFLTLINAAVSHELRNPLNSLINQAMFMKSYLLNFKKLISARKNEQDRDNNKVFEEIEAIVEGIDGCARKMQNATKLIDFFVGDILDYSVINEASENFKK